MPRLSLPSPSLPSFPNPSLHLCSHLPIPQGLRGQAGQGDRGDSAPDPSKLGAAGAPLQQGLTEVWQRHRSGGGMRHVTQIPWIGIPGAGAACQPLRRAVTEGKDPAQARPRSARPASSKGEFVMWGRHQQPKWMGKAILCAPLILPGDSRSKLPAPGLSSLLPLLPREEQREQGPPLCFFSAKALRQLCIRNCHSNTPLPLCHHFINLSWRVSVDPVPSGCSDTVREVRGVGKG